jgi:hypothetical protein
MRSAPLTTIKGGISRLRTRGGARADTLYDLKNGYVIESGEVVARPGTERMATLDSLTRGLCAFNGSLHTFCHTSVTVPDGYTLNIITHPEPPDTGYYYDQTPTLEVIHFAEPFLGGLYIVAEFSDGEIFHFWLQTGETWEADTVYTVGALVSPTTANGLVYQAERYGPPSLSWAPDVPRYTGDGYEDQSVVEPTTYNGFYYECIDTDGGNPRSGTVEPTWPEEEDAQVVERTDTGLAQTEPTDSTPPTTTPAPTQNDSETGAQYPDPSIWDRYGLRDLER